MISNISSVVKKHSFRFWPLCVGLFPTKCNIVNSSVGKRKVVLQEMLFTCAFCSGETRQHTTEWQLRLNPRRSTRRVGSSAYIRHLPSIMRANFLSGVLVKECRASSWKLFRLCFTESLITRAISTGSPWKDKLCMARVGVGMQKSICYWW